MQLRTTNGIDIQQARELRGEPTVRDRGTPRGVGLQGGYFTSRVWAMVVGWTRHTSRYVPFTCGVTLYVPLVCPQYDLLVREARDLVKRRDFRRLAVGVGWLLEQGHEVGPELCERVRDVSRQETMTAPASTKTGGYAGWFAAMADVRGHPGNDRTRFQSQVPQARPHNRRGQTR